VASPVLQPEAAPPHSARRLGRTRGEKLEGGKQSEGILKTNAWAVRKPLTASLEPSASPGRRHLPHDTYGTPSPPSTPCAHPQSISITNALAPPPPRRASGRRLQVPEGWSRISPRVLSTRQWAEAPRELAPALSAHPSQSEGAVCVRGQVGRGTQLRTGRPCSQVPGSRWRPESSVRRQQEGRFPPPTLTRACAPGPSLSATLLGSRAAAAVPLPSPQPWLRGTPLCRSAPSVPRRPVPRPPPRPRLSRRRPSTPSSPAWPPACSTAAPSSAATRRARGTHTT
jgi:hypothetical protein